MESISGKIITIHGAEEIATKIPKFLRGNK